ncbi:MAG: N4-gp56 family major capsid protein [Betaproteobacteria bacterium RBG_16_56_24]|nr:MAG: N4-gp56 family major capsid protein [Betaproteobacteria bacterium RBG_16_56_24]
MKTTIGVGDAKAVRRYSAELAIDTRKESYFSRKFMGEGQKAMACITVLNELTSDKGELISYDLALRKRMKPIQGDNTLRGQEEDRKFATASLYIDQLRGGSNLGGRMSRKRTIHELRDSEKPLQAQWWASLFDEAIFMYLSGGGRDTVLDTTAAGASIFSNTDFIEETGFVGYAGNTFEAPSAYRQLYANNATSIVSLDSADIMALELVDRAVARAKSGFADASGNPIPALQSIKVDGEDHYVCVMSPFQAHNLRTASGSEWLAIQKAAAAAEGRNNPIFKGGLGMHNNVVLHEHPSILTRSNAGSGANLPGARALFLGRQAGVVAFGSPGTGLRFNWQEEEEDRGNQIVITSNSILGIDKCTFAVNETNYDFGVIALDTYAIDPNA